MINYVIINGVNSNTIQGLKINIMPPITKPMIRTQTEEIDGRDGDLITELGYSSYDKQMEIGLWGTYDINAIIKYFTGEGKIIFSTEPDKYYYFKILDQIDYEKLLKFKKATITFHCQPYKYPVEETPLVETYEYIEETGTDISINTEESSMKISPYGNTYQNGTPTPDTPIPVQVVSGDNEVVVCGKNLFDKTTITVGKRFDGSGNLINDNDCIVSDYINILSNTTYYSTQPISSVRCVCCYDKDKTFLSRLMYLGTNTFTTTNDTKYIRVALLKEGVDGATIEYEQIEKGNQATTYTPYVSQTYPITLPVGTELCKIGTYQDSIVKDNGKWYLNKQIGKITYDGTEDWGLSNNVFYKSNSTILQQGNIKSAKSNYFKEAYNQASTTNVNTYNPDNSICGSTTGTNRFYIKCTSITSTDNFKTWLSTHNTIVYYVLATPTYTEITDSTLLGQLVDLEEAYSYSPQTNISQVNNDLPFELDVIAMSAGSGILEINNIGTAYAMPTIALEGTGNVSITLNDEQVLQVDMTTKNEITIDSENMDAYAPDGTLANRLITGDYNNLKLSSGTNTMKFGGDFTKATVTDYTRWI